MLNRAIYKATPWLPSGINLKQKTLVCLFEPGHGGLITLNKVKEKIAFITFVRIDLLMRARASLRHDISSQIILLTKPMRDVKHVSLNVLLDLTKN